MNKRRDLILLTERSHGFNYCGGVNECNFSSTRITNSLSFVIILYKVTKALKNHCKGL